MTARAIDWELIARHYDQLVKYAAALRRAPPRPSRCCAASPRAAPSTRPSRPSKSSAGWRTAFICDYLASEQVRREIHQGLEVMENWNSANTTLHYANDSELTGSDREHQGVSMLALHLLQAGLVHLNTILVQRVLADKGWSARLTDEDRRGLSPLFWTHVNLYGKFTWDMDRHLNLDLESVA